jgi:Mlc titration factor MtfA (ptsG expression regulator)
MLGFLRHWGRPPRDRDRQLAELLRLSAELPLLQRLGPEQRERLSRLALELLRHKAIDGAAGLVVNERMRQVTALQACLPVLNLGLDLYRGWYSFILYPGEFLAPFETVDEAGVVHQGDRELSGESWEQGPVILAWDSVEADAFDPEPAGNVTIHEMAHKLDLLNGDVNGMPPLPRDMDPGRWTRAFKAAYADLNRRLKRGREPPIDPYAADSPGELFAVASELFFAWPESLLDAYPEVYGQLALYYRQTPAASEVVLGERDAV